MITYSIIKKSQLEGAKRLDAEYYQPEFLNLNSKLKAQNSKFLNDLASNVICGPFGSAILNEDYRKTGIPLIRVADLNNWFVRDNSLAFIEDELATKLRRYQVNKDDIVVSQRGTIAMFSKITNFYPKWNISANLISIKKSNLVSFDYLLAFLNSSYGLKQLYRKLSGQVQPKITTDDIKQILVFLPDNKQQEEVAKFVKKALEEQENSKSLYQQAQNLLLQELNINETDLENKLWCIVNLSETKDAKRIDAEYFQKKYKNLEAKIKNHKPRELGELVSVKKGIEPGAESYQEQGKQFIRVSSLSKYGINENDQKYLSEDLYHQLKKDFEPKKGEILLTKDASPGIAYVVKDDIEGIISSGILRLKLKSENIEDEYLALCLNSIVGQMQAQRDAGGSIIKHWKPDQIKKVIIPILSKEKQQKITKLIRDSFDARRKAKQLLEEAKKKVEDLIENK
jgi:restriction endonuclease S subunit